MGGTPRWGRGQAWGGRSGRDKALWSDHSLHSPSPCTAWGYEVEELKVNLSLGRKKGWGKGVWVFFFFLFLIIIFQLIGNKLNLFPQIESALHMSVVGEWCPCPDLNWQAFCHIFSSCSVKVSVIEWHDRHLVTSQAQHATVLQMCFLGKNLLHCYLHPTFSSKVYTYRCFYPHFFQLGG